MKIVFSIGKGLYLAYHGYTPYCLEKDFDGDFDEMVLDIAWDSDTAPRQGKDFKKYIVLDVELPKYIRSFEEYKSKWFHIRDFGKWINFQALNHRNLTESNHIDLWQLYLDGQTEILFIIQMLFRTKKTRSEFRLSIIAQIMDWLNTSKEERKYKSPLSRNQVRACLKYSSHDYYCVNSIRVSPIH